jgi:CBS domain-containing protein
MANKISSKVQRNVVTIDGHRSVLEAAIVMTDKYIGSVVVTDAARIVGIFTERDIMMKVIGKKKEPAETKVSDVMSKELVKVSPTDSCNYCLDLMKEKRCRHLMVFDSDEFVGILSLRDLVAYMLDEKEVLITYLESYISGT